MRRVVCLCALLFLAEPAFAQRTVVSGTVTDSTTLPYSNASLTVTLVTPVGTAGAYLNGAQIAGTVGPVQLDATGSFIVQLADNTQVKCANAQGQLVTCAPQTQWSFAVTLSPGVAPPIGTGPKTCTATLTISGASQSVSSSLNSCPALTQLPSPIGGVFSTNIVDVVNQGAKFDGQLVYDVSCTLNSPTVTCPNNDCNFTTAQVGRQAWVVDGHGCNGAASNCNVVIGTVGAAPPTVLAVPGAQTITLSANANANCAAACAIFVGDDDTTPMLNAYNLASGKCGTLILPTGITTVRNAIFSDPAGTSTCSIFAAVGSRQATTVRGWGSASTIIVPSINFDMTTCTATFGGAQPGGACFGSLSNNAHGTALQGFTVYGMGVNLGASANNKVGIAVGGTGNNYNIYDVQLSHWNGNATGGVGLFLGGGTTMLEAVQSDGMMNTACTYGGANLLIHGSYFCGDTVGPGLNIIGSPVASYGGQYCSFNNPIVAVGGGVTFYSTSEQFGTGICFGTGPNQKIFNGGGSTLYLTNAQVQGLSANDIGFDFSGPIYMTNSIMTINGAGGACFRESGTTTFFDLGGNNISCSTLLNTTGFLTGLTVIGDGHSVEGSCTGTATASSTLGLYGTGPNETVTTCTSATIGSGKVVSGARKVWALNVIAGTAGVNASSGVVTVLQNGVATAMTCTIGTGTTCSDGQHTFTTSDGDRISLQFTTQAADTLANVKATVIWN